MHYSTRLKINITISIYEAQGKLFKGSSHGWVATVEDAYSTDICLINPLTRSLIKIPPRSTFPDVISYDVDSRNQEYALYDCDNRFVSCESVNRFCTKKLVMLSNPSGNDCMVVTIYRFGLAYCKINDKKWNPLHFGQIYNFCVDVIVHKGKLHALDMDGEVLCFENIGFVSTESDVKVVAKALPMKSSYNLKYLVECSDGGLIMVARYMEFLKDQRRFKGDAIRSTRYFEVYKLDMNSRWVEVKNIGNDILFLCLNSSFSVPSNQFPSSKGNQIFFADTFSGYDAKGNYRVGADMGVFNLEDGTIQPLKWYPENFWPPVIWVNV